MREHLNSFSHIYKHFLKFFFLRVGMYKANTNKLKTLSSIPSPGEGREEGKATACLIQVGAAYWDEG